MSENEEIFQLPKQQRPFRLAYVVSHPIQYQVPLLRRIAADPSFELTVFYCSDFSLRSYKDEGFGTEFTWDVPLTGGYQAVFLPRWRDTHNPSVLAPIARGFFRAFLKGIDGKRFDAVWVHGYSSLNSIHAIVAARLAGLPVMIRADIWLRDRPRSKSKLLLKQMYFRVLRSMISAVLAIGTRNAEYWAHYFGSTFPVFLMPYAVDNDFFARGRAIAQATRGELQAELQMEPGRPVILFASKLQKRKHCDDLLEAYLGLLDEFSPEQRPYLLIVGDGEQMQELRERVEQASASLVRFTGFRNQSELPRYFDLATVFVLPSRHEPWGLIVNEAMAVSLPVIVSDDVGCAIDLVRDGDNGFVYPVGDRVALQEALRSSLQPGAAERMGTRSRAIIDQWSFDEDMDVLKQAMTFLTMNRHKKQAS